MFKIDPAPRFTHPVRVQVPTNGGHEEQTFRVTFAVLPTDKEPEFDVTTMEGTTAFLRAIVVGMDDIGDAEGKAVPYNDTVRDAVLALPYVRSAIARAYRDAVAKAALGN